MKLFLIPIKRYQTNVSHDYRNSAFWGDYLLSIRGDKKDYNSYKEAIIILLFEKWNVNWSSKKMTNKKIALDFFLGSQNAM